MAKASNVYKLPTAEERQKGNECMARAYMDCEDDIRNLAIMAALARELHFKEAENGHPISPAGSPLFAILENVDPLARRMWERFHAAT